MKKEFSIPTPIHVVDAFARGPFTGNPAAVCFLTDTRSDVWMQQVAAEMNLSETAFFKPLEDGSWQLRWFTPACEVDLCGHATLATAHIIWSTDLADPEETLRFHTRSGILEAVREGDRIRLDFPLKAPEQAPIPQGLEEALGAPILWYGQNGVDGIARLQDADTIRRLSPDMPALSKLDLRGIIVTSSAEKGQPYDFVSRFFAPRVGVPEDPVTGSAHCCLAGFWGAILGKTQMEAYQASARGGEMTIRVKGDRVHMLGQSVTVLQGVLTLPSGH